MQLMKLGRRRCIRLASTKVSSSLVFQRRSQTRWKEKAKEVAFKEQSSSANFCLCLRPPLFFSRGCPSLSFASCIAIKTRATRKNKISQFLWHNVARCPRALRRYLRVPFAGFFFLYLARLIMIMNKARQKLNCQRMRRAAHEQKRRKMRERAAKNWKSTFTISSIRDKKFGRVGKLKSDSQLCARLPMYICLFSSIPSIVRGKIERRTFVITSKGDNSKVCELSFFFSFCFSLEKTKSEGKMVADNRVTDGPKLKSHRSSVNRFL